MTRVQIGEIPKHHGLQLVKSIAHWVDGKTVHRTTYDDLIPVFVRNAAASR